MTTPVRARKRAGFTLLELLVVLVLLAITAAAAVPAFLGNSTAAPERRAATALASILNEARDAARESGAPVTVMLSPSDGRYWLTTHDSTSVGVLPREPGVRMIGSDPDRISCRFEPYGTATPLTVTLEGARSIAVTVNPWNGGILIGDGSAAK